MKVCRKKSLLLLLAIASNSLASDAAQTSSDRPLTLSSRLPRPTAIATNEQTQATICELSLAAAEVARDIGVADYVKQLREATVRSQQQSGSSISMETLTIRDKLTDTILETLLQARAMVS